MSGLEARDLTIRLAGRAVLDNISMAILPGALVAIVGPNGAGKSTLLKALAGDIRPDAGSVLLDGRPLPDIANRDLAIRRAVLPQAPELAFAFRGWDVVELGRHPHRCAEFDNRRAIAGAMASTETTAFAARDIDTLSGGERHRVHYARVLAQVWGTAMAGTRALLLDEPTASLDLFHQHAILAKARDFARDGLAVAAVLHDLNLAVAYADRILVLAGGRIDAIGAPREVVTQDRIRRVWKVDCDIAAPPDPPYIVVWRRLETSSNPRPHAAQASQRDA